MGSAWRLVVVLLPLLTRQAAAVRVHYLHWNSSNPIFRIDNTDHIVDVNQGNLPFEYDQLNIVCPAYQRGTRAATAGPPERYIIYNVSKEEYDTCRISQAEPRVVAVCNKPDQQLQFTITFRSFSPTPRGLEFRPGQDYYFISTSSRRELRRRAGGSCQSHNMKVIFKVAANSGTAGRGAAVNVPRSSPSSPPPSLHSDADQYKDILRPISDVRPFQTGLTQITKDRYDRDQAGVIKQEASTMSTAPGIFSPGLVLTILASLLLRQVF